MITITITAGGAMLWALAALVAGLVAVGLFAGYLWCRMIYTNFREPREPVVIPKPASPDAVPAVPPVGMEGPPELYRPDTVVRKFR